MNMATTDDSFDSLRRAFDAFHKTLDAMTILPDGSGRIVSGIADAVLLSESARALSLELAGALVRLLEAHGEPDAMTPTLKLRTADSPDGPWAEVSDADAPAFKVEIGGDGASASLVAAMQKALVVVAFKQTSPQAANPGATRQRFQAGDRISADDLATLDSAARLLRLETSIAQSRIPDNDDAKPTVLPAEADAIDESDLALLEFLNRKPNVRRKVSDVLPEKGPQDRKAVANRLRKLAKRTPPLVDYNPKSGRSGVAILPAGVQALKRATPPTPR